jgi:MFS transporter, MHS family, proline/betaine transporter
MKKYFGRIYLPAFLGTAIEYYDIALYGYMAPILVQVFLPHLDKMTAYFYYFFFECFAALFQLAGSRFFGKMGDTHGRKKVLYSAMLGTSIITFCICLLPTYKEFGITAAALFVLCRSLQSFFLGGEYNGGAIYCLEHELNTKRHGLVSGLYCSLTVVGILGAALVATLITYWGKEYFRIAYLLSFCFAVLTYFLRRDMQETPVYLKAREVIEMIPPSVIRRRALLLIMSASLFFGILYGLPSRIFNALLPLTTGLSSTAIMMMNTLLLVVYMILLTVFGFISDKIGTSRLMRSASLATIVLAYPLMLLIETKSVFLIVSAKTIFFILAAAFIGPFHAWAQEMFDAKNRYAQISIGYSLGKIVSTLLLSLSIILFEQHKSLTDISLILIACALLPYVLLREESYAYAYDLKGK